MARKKVTYWDDHGKNGFYQMGPNPVRSYILDTLERKNVKTLLDIGCGSGPIYELMKQREMDIDYTGSDYSSSFVDFNKSQFPEVKWETDDMRKLDKFKSDDFDCLLYLHSLDHVGGGWCDALDQAHRVTNRYVMIVLWRPFVVDKPNISSHADFDDSHLIDFHKKSLESYMKNIGFKTLISKEIMNDKQYNYFYLIRKP